MCWCCIVIKMWRHVIKQKLLFFLFFRTVNSSAWWVDLRCLVLAINSNNVQLSISNCNLLRHIHIFIWVLTYIIKYIIYKMSSYLKQSCLVAFSESESEREREDFHQAVRQEKWIHRKRHRPKTDGKRCKCETSNLITRLTYVCSNLWRTKLIPICKV